MRKFFDWSTDRTIAVRNPKSEPFTVDPGATLTLFNGSRTTSISNSTEFDLTLSPLDEDRYRFTWSGTGANPAFRTDRGLTLGTSTIQMTANPNSTVSMAGLAGDFTTVEVGDVLFIPDTSTGDPASPFDVLNVGYWTVLAKDGTSAQIELARPTGVSFTGKTEAVMVATDVEVLAYSAAGVQVGDKVTLSIGFASPVLGTYFVVAVTPEWFEITTTKALPVQATGVPTTSGIQFYSGAKRYLRFEADQLCAIRLNGDTGSTVVIEPFLAGDPQNTGIMEKIGPAWSAAVVNQSSAPLNLLLTSAE